MIKRPALRYYGGKWKLAPWIISYFPPHRHYVEPCGGAGSVLLQKGRSELETFNDIDNRVVNFFRVLRDHSEELIAKLKLTPWARQEYIESYLPTDDPIESARRFFVLCWMSVSGQGTGWRRMRDWSTRRRATPTDIIDIDHLYLVAERFKGVQIECCLDALEIVRGYDSLETIFYIDPPYLAETRTKKNQYLYEWVEEQHVEMAERLREIQGYAIISGYDHPLYRDLYGGWAMRMKRTVTSNGTCRMECLWLSPGTEAALVQQPRLL